MFCEKPVKVVLNHPFTFTLFSAAGAPLFVGAIWGMI